MFLDLIILCITTITLSVKNIKVEEDGLLLTAAFLSARCPGTDTCIVGHMGENTQN